MPTPLKRYERTAAQAFIYELQHTAQFASCAEAGVIQALLTLFNRITDKEFSGMLEEVLLPQDPAKELPSSDKEAAFELFHKNFRQVGILNSPEAAAGDSYIIWSLLNTGATRIPRLFQDYFEGDWTYTIRRQEDLPVDKSV